MSFGNRDRGSSHAEAQKEAISVTPEALGSQSEKDSVKARSEALQSRVGSAEGRIMRVQDSATKSRLAMEQAEQTLNNMDPEWRQGKDSFDRASSTEMDAHTTAQKGIYDAASKNFDDVLSGLGDANKEYSVSKNHQEAFEKHGVDLEKRGTEIATKKAELQRVLISADKYESPTRAPMLEEYLRLDAEGAAIADETWEKKQDNGWLPKEANVPDFMPNFKATFTVAHTEKYETNSELSKQITEREDARKKAEALNVRQGRKAGDF